MNWLSNLWKKWFGKGTSDDYRNPFWRLTEYLAVNVLWAYTILRYSFISYRQRWQMENVRYSFTI